MHNMKQFQGLVFRVRSRAATAALAIAFLLIVVASQPAQAQTYKVLHNFTGGSDGAYPFAGLTVDKAGNLYGTAPGGGDLTCNAPYGCGTVYKLVHKGSGWTFNPLYTFNGGSDGANPEARVIFGPNGTLYGTTDFGGTGGCSYNGPGCGTVFNLRPQATACRTVLCPWTETILYDFVGPLDGEHPDGDLLFDQAGDIYGVTVRGGGTGCGSGNGCGTVYELTPSGNGWTKSVVYAFAGYPNDGQYLYGGVVLDNAGSLYGVNESGGKYGDGTVFQLSPSGSGWTENVLYAFQGGSDGGRPYGGLIFDQSGNLFGATTDYGLGGGGTAFELTPTNGGWTLKTLYSFTGTAGNTCGPKGTLVMDGAGNLYGTTYCDGANNAGSIFKLTRSGNSWTYTSLHDFTGGSDGGNSVGNVVFDANGNVYGTAENGGDLSCSGGTGCGVVWEIMP